MGLTHKKRRVARKILYFSSKIICLENFTDISTLFSRDEYLAVRNDEGAFYLCKAMQNIYIGSRNITIQWFSNEEHIIPAKDNPKQDIFAPDFYDKTGKQSQERLNS